MAKLVTVDITKKWIFLQNDKYYVRFDADILDLESSLTERHGKALYVTDDHSLTFIEVEKLATDAMINFKISTENE